GLVLLITTFLLFQPGHAQETPSETCSAFTRTAILQAGNNCAGLKKNQICYGYQNVRADVYGSSENLELLHKPADTLDLTHVAVIDTEGLNPIEGVLGIAPIRIHANLPVALPGKGLMLMPIGEVELENGVRPEEALILPEKSLSVVTVDKAVLYSEPSSSGLTAGTVVGGAILDADSISADSQWVRVYFEYETQHLKHAGAWVNLDSLVPDRRIAKLPVNKPDSQTPMQTFFLRNNIQDSGCGAALPSLLYIQAPEDIGTQVTVNGAVIDIHSTIILQVVAPGNRMRLTVLSGVVLLYPGTPDEFGVPAGFVTEICLSAPQSLGLDQRPNDQIITPDCGWTSPRQLTPNELESLYPLQSIPANVTNYALSLPEIVCPSGVGQPICEVSISDAGLLSQLRQLCQENVLHPATCSAIRGISS
ncbi:MAG: hypothetical protein K8I82_00185, partial [Anaerolineae bacterium]|nr:hypothetical protein [Anaerolineae bacterium]